MASSQSNVASVIPSSRGTNQGSQFLPAEVLLEVFRIATNWAKLLDKRRYHQQSLTLAQVCATWRVVALGASDLWSGIICGHSGECPWGNPESPENSLRIRIRVETLLERSRNTSISILLDTRSHKMHTTSDDLLGSEILLVFQEHIIPHSSRIRSLDVRLGSVAHVRAVFPLTSPFPHLDTLNFGISCPLVAQDFPDGRLSLFDGLSHVHIKALIVQTPVTVSLNKINVASLEALSHPGICALDDEPNLPLSLPGLRYLSTHLQDIGEHINTSSLTMLELHHWGFSSFTMLALNPTGVLPPLYNLGTALSNLKYLVITLVVQARLHVQALFESLRSATSLEHLDMRNISQADVQIVLIELTGSPQSAIPSVLSSLRLVEITSNEGRDHTINGVRDIAAEFEPLNLEPRRVFRVDGFAFGGLSMNGHDDGELQQIRAEEARLRRLVDG
ncbi:hypothetical protein DL93DRAFT_2170464 [Clavulina sp. PMI_390]|nr:hypothetical protein DL93DRAFT_2170464 [Clavulina sp. PMI_390]